MKIKCIILFTILASSIFGQNILFDKDSSGVHLAGQFSPNNNSTLLGFIPGYTYKGILTIGLGIGYEESKNSDKSTRAISPYFSCLVMKQDVENSPVSISFDGAYQYNTFSTIANYSTYSLRVGAGIFHKINASENLNIIPGLGVSYVLTTSNNSYGSSPLSYNFNLTAKINKFYVVPNMTFNRGESRLDLVFGFVFPK